jgi:bis(5'-nucleosyl)-tetraphosphatase (symmetrical)
MSTYAIGDVQGCFPSLEKLLNEIQYDAQKDALWFTGDIVNRGPHSLETLRFIKNLNHKQMVLGNHDLHLLAVESGAHSGWNEDTLRPILEASDRHELIGWLRHQPLLFFDPTLDFVMVHAGLAPAWNLKTALILAHEVENVLRDPAAAAHFFKHMYGNEPTAWDEQLQGFDRLRCITNYLTRLRFCHQDGSMELQTKGQMNLQNHVIPWFQVPSRQNLQLKILFGHWAALGGITNTPNVFALDTGCAWGYCLTAMRLEDEKRFSVPC